MRVGITGGTGYLGGHLTLRLLDRGDEVTAFTRNPDRARERVAPGVRLEAWDSPREPLSPAVLSTLDAVVHLAGESVAGPWTAARKARIRESRTAGTRQVVAGLRAAAPRPRVLVSSSATGFYGDRGDEELTEESTGGRGFLADVAREWEFEAHHADELGVRVVRLRTGLPLGKDGGVLGTLLTPFRAGLGARLGHGRQFMPWIHLEDWLALALFTLDTGSLSGPVNATAPHPARNADFTRALGAALRRPAILVAPAFALKLLGDQGREMLLAGQRAFPAAAEEAGFAFRHPALEPALRHLLAGS